MSDTLDTALREAETVYIAANPASLTRHEEARKAMPGGNTRTILHYAPFPLGWAKGEDAILTDLDNHTYIDFLGDYSAGLYGHSHPQIQNALRQVINQGTTLGGPNVYEAEFSHLLKSRFPSLQSLRFCNSGTEANILALMTALAHTGREKVMVFKGGYHGGVLSFSHDAHPINLPLDWVVAPYNDVEATLDIIRRHGTELAAILVEPMLGSGGCLPARKDFLSALRQAASELDIILIFDEVMTSRLSSGGLQAAFGITPDMTTLGKYLGGGAPFGAFGGRIDIMDHYNPEKPGYWPHAGTFNNNVISMAAGLTGLRDIYTAETAIALNTKGNRLRDGLNACAKNHGLNFRATGYGSLIGIHFCKNTLDQLPNLAADETKRREKLHQLMHLDFIASGIFFAPRGYIALNLALSDSDIDRFIAQTDAFLKSRRSLLTEVAQDSHE